jgi:hypothetical protein
MTKKLARIEPQSTLRRLVMRPSAARRDVEAQAVAQLQAQRLGQALLDADRAGLAGVQRPATTSLCAGQVAAWTG